MWKTFITKQKSQRFFLTEREKMGTLEYVFIRSSVCFTFYGAAAHRNSNTMHT